LAKNDIDIAFNMINIVAIFMNKRLEGCFYEFPVVVMGCVVWGVWGVLDGKMEWVNE
jgi:hypothetical protein